MKRPNFYILLGLPLDPPTTDPVLVEKAIEEKKAFWNKNRTHPTNGSRFKQYGEMIEELREHLSDPGRLRKEGESARGELLKELDRAISDCATDGTISPEELNYLVKNFPQFRPETIKARAPVPLGEPGAPKSVPPPRKPSVAPNIKMPETLTMELIDANLEVLGVGDLYEFLELRASCTCETLFKTVQAKELENRKTSKKTAVVDARGVLLGLAGKVFAEESTKRGYDAKLRLWKFEKRLAPVLLRRSLNEIRSPENKVIGHTVSLNDYRRSVDDARELGLSSDEAEWYVYDYFVTKRKCPDPRTEEPLATANKPQCSVCYRLNEPDAKICCSCGAPLKAVCPNPGCRKSVTFGTPHCPSCGFPVGDMPLALNAMKKAKAALIEDNPEAAQSYLQSALLLWPNIEEAASLGTIIQQKLREYREKTKRDEELSGRILEAIRNRTYFKAEQELLQLRLYSPRHPLLAVKEPEVSGVLEEVKSMFEKSKSLADPRELAILYARVLEICSDCREASEKLNSIPLSAPGRAEANAGANGIEIRWMPSLGGFGTIEYIVVRKENSGPSGPSDGEVIVGGTSQTSAIDSSAEPGAVYGYAVFARRSNARPEQTGAKTNLVQWKPFLRNIQVIPGDAKLEMRWMPMRNVTRFRVMRYESGGTLEPMPIHRVLPGGFVDPGLANNKTYEYVINIGYRSVEGMEKWSPDEIVKGIPAPPPKPVTEIFAVAAGSAVGLRWAPPHPGEVFLFESLTPFAETIGQVLPFGLSEMKTKYGPPIPIKDAKNGTTLWIADFTGKRFLLPVTAVGNVLTAGASKEITLVQNVGNVISRSLNGKLYITWNWPPGLNKVLLTFRNDEFPLSPSDPNATRKFVAIEEYKLDDAFVLNQPLKQNLFVTIFSVFEEKTGGLNFSSGVRHQTEKTIITYRTEVRPATFFRKAQLRLHLEVLSGYSKMPGLTVMKSRMRPSLRKDDGHVLSVIPPHNAAVNSIELAPEEIEKNAFIRLFIEKAADCDHFAVLDPWQEDMQLWK